MRRSNRLIILLGVFLAIAGGLATAVVLSQGGGTTTPTATATPTPEPTTTVVIAKQDINLGDTITAAMVDTRQMTVTQTAALGGDTFSNVNQVIGKIAGGSITAGQVLLGSRDFLSAGTMVEGQDLAGSVGTGMVAVSMLIDQVSGVGTLIVPGDHVDIILSVYITQLNLTTKDQAGTQVDLKGGSDVTTKMVIQNRKILATLASPTQNGAAAPTPVPGSSAQPAARPTQSIVQNDNRTMIVVMEVKPDEAEVLRWAQREEKQDPQNYIDLSLALRSSKDNDLPSVTTPGITLKMLIDKYGVLPLDPRAILPADIAKGISW